MMGSSAQDERALGVDMARLLASRTAAAAAAARGSGAAGEKAARLEECIRSLEAEKAKMEVFRRELPISVNLIADVIEWMKDEVVAEQRRPAPEKEMFAPAPPSRAAAAAKRKAEGVKVEADANEKRSWMSSAQLWSCGGSHDSTSNSNGGVGVGKKQAHKVSNAFMEPSTFAKSPAAAECAAAAASSPVPADLSLSSPVATDAAPSATSSAVTDYAGAPRPSQQRKARRSWSPELHRRFVSALQRLGGPQAATPKQIRDLMKVDGLTNDEVKSHLQKYRLHTRRASDQQAVGLWSPPPDQYTTSQHSTSQSGSPQGPLQLTGSSRAVSMTAEDSCGGGEEEEEEDGRSESYSWEIQNGEKASSS